VRKARGNLFFNPHHIGASPAPKVACGVGLALYAVHTRARAQVGFVCTVRDSLRFASFPTGHMSCLLFEFLCGGQPRFSGCSSGVVLYNFAGIGVCSKNSPAHFSVLQARRDLGGSARCLQAFAPPTPRLQEVACSLSDITSVSLLADSSRLTNDPSSLLVAWVV